MARCNDATLAAFADRLYESARDRDVYLLAASTGIHVKRLKRLMDAALTAGPTLSEVERLASVLGTSPAKLAGWAK